VTKSRPVSEVDIARAQVGLEATNELLEVKRDALQALEGKMAEVVCTRLSDFLGEQVHD